MVGFEHICCCSRRYVVKGTRKKPVVAQEGTDEPLAEPPGPAANEELAAYAHDAWSRWMRYLFSKSRLDRGSVTIPAELVERWTRQMNIAYRDLPESEKKSDRDESRVMMRIFIGEDDESHVP
jgi:hypothetical protein